MILIPKLPSIFHLFGHSGYKQLLALDIMIIERRQDKSLAECLDMFNNEYPGVNSPEKVEEWAKAQLEYVSPHIHIIEDKPDIFQYLNNREEVEVEIHRWWIDRFDFNLMHGIDIEEWPEELPEYSHYKALLFDRLGSFNKDQNKLSINLKAIDNQCSNDVKFTFKELVDLVTYHNYGHWISLNLNITFTPRDHPFSDRIEFQELFANWCVLLILNNKEDSELLSKFKEHLHELDDQSYNPFVIHPYLFESIGIDLFDSIGPKIILFCARESEGDETIEFVEYVKDYISEFDDVNHWINHIDCITEEFFNQEFFHNEFYDCLTHKVISNFYCDCNFDALHPSKKIDGEFSFYSPED